jgi:uncharacterized membrane protein YadS
MTAKSKLLTSEDWWAVYLGIAIVAVAAIGAASGSVFDFIKGAIPAAWPSKPLLPGLGSTWPAYVAVFSLLLVTTGLGVKAMGGKLGPYAVSFVLLFLAAAVVLALGSQQTLKLYGLESPFWALVIGLVIGNLFNLPQWFREASGRTEFFIKTGVVLLGASFPFTTIVQGGGWGFIEALVIVVAGFTVAFLVGRAMGFDKRFIAVLGAGGSVCGVSAAIAVGSSVDEDKKKVGYVVTLVVVFGLVLIFLIPFLGRILGFNDTVIGAWIGGSELADASGLAAASMVGEKAVSAFSLVKLNRDVFIGFLSFIFATLAIARWDVASDGSGSGSADKPAKGRARPSPRMIWERFPKFVLAFLLASALVTTLTGSMGKPVVDAHIIGVLNTLRTWFFTLTFLCIGLNARLGEMRAIGAKPIVTFTAVVLVNLVLGCILANLLFGGILANPLG